MSPEHMVAARSLEYETKHGFPINLTNVEDYVSGPLGDGQFEELKRTVSSTSGMQYLTTSKGSEYEIDDFDSALIYAHKWSME